MLALTLITLAFEVLLFRIPVLWEYRRYIVLIYCSVLGFITGLTLAAELSSINTLIGVISVFRVLNYARIAKGRMHPEYMHKATASTALFLGCLQAVLVAASFLGIAPHLLQMLPGLTWMQLIVAVLLLTATGRTIIKSRHQPQDEHYADKELPTVSVLIPARNETFDLENCLYSLLASDYPKLEILVLDDCSQARTSEIIRGFAQDGVRFIKGAEPDAHWLAKNQAYERLRQEASGELLLFCGVDVRFGPRSVRSLVTTLMNRNKDMISIMPRGFVNTPLSSIIQPMRYWWELALPRRPLNKPPVLSTCWLIKSEVLEGLGGFKAVMRAIIPEAYLAREIVKMGERYSLIRSDDVLDIQTVKSVVDQQATALRIRYPQLRKKPEYVFIFSLAEVTFLLGPFLLVMAHSLGWLELQVLPALMACIFLLATHTVIATVSSPASVPTAILTFPLGVLSELYLLYESMIRYEFKTVVWKDRNVCIPVMHVEKKLPSA